MTEEHAEAEEAQEKASSAKKKAEDTLLTANQTMEDLRIKTLELAGMMEEYASQLQEAARMLKPK